MYPINPMGVKKDIRVIEYHLESLTNDISSEIIREIPEHPLRTIKKKIDGKKLSEALQGKFLSTLKP